VGGNFCGTHVMPHGKYDLLASDGLTGDETVKLSPRPLLGEEMSAEYDYTEP
jgi:hypothetical protein